MKNQVFLFNWSNECIGRLGKKRSDEGLELARRWKKEMMKKTVLWTKNRCSLSFSPFLLFFVSLFDRSSNRSESLETNRKIILKSK